MAQISYFFYRGIDLRAIYTIYIEVVKKRYRFYLNLYMILLAVVVVVGRNRLFVSAFAFIDFIPTHF